MNQPTAIRKGKFSSLSFQKNMITGLFIVMPIIISITVFVFLINFIMGLFRINNLTELIMKNDYFGQVDAAWIRIYFVIFFTLLFLSLIYLIGLFARYIFMKKLLRYFDNILYKIPLFNKIYSTVKQISGSFMGDKAALFRKVILLEWPRKGLYCIGFVTYDGEKMLPEIKSLNNNYCYVFIPTTPNPTTGYFVIIPKSEIIEINISVEDAMKMIISGGVVSPEIRMDELLSGESE
jgi:uncharacterized membrane protein